jgi:large subunit ribosomal protein L33
MGSDEIDGAPPVCTPARVGYTRRRRSGCQRHAAAVPADAIAAAQGAIMRDLIKLTCQACKRDNYVTDKNKRTMTEKFAIKKFCNACRKHTEHKEGKISKG